jgi:fatty-acyl-CoA synthase
MNIPLTPLRFLRYAEEQFASRIAVVCSDERFTYKEFATRVSLVAGGLLETGVQPGSRIGILSTNCHRLLEAYYAVLEAGCVLLPLNTRLSANELAYIVNDSGASILFFEEEYRESVDALRRDTPSLKAFYPMDGPSNADQASEQECYEGLIRFGIPHRHDISELDENGLAELFYTSGTTAAPKGVMLSHRNVYLHTLNHCLTFNTTEALVHLHTIPLFHVNGWGAAHYLYLGAKHVMLKRFSPEAVFKLIEAEEVTSMALVPTMVTDLVNSPDKTRYKLHSLRRIRVGGSAPSYTLVREVEEKLGGVCFGAYGLTEASPSLTTSTVKPGMPVEGAMRLDLQSMSGYPIPGTELKIIDSAGMELPHDGMSSGELVARSDGVMMGYWNNPSASAEVLADGWLRTGDIATVDPQGYVRIVDRRKDIIISGGENISSLELEAAILTHPSVMEVAVVSIPDPKWGEVPMAFIVLKPDVQCSEREIVGVCRERLSHYKVPKVIKFVLSLPKTGSGKVMKKELRKPFWESG